MLSVLTVCWALVRQDNAMLQAKSLGSLSPGPLALPASILGPGCTVCKLPLPLTPDAVCRPAAVEPCCTAWLLVLLVGLLVRVVNIRYQSRVSPLGCPSRSTLAAALSTSTQACAWP